MKASDMTQEELDSFIYYYGMGYNLSEINKQPMFAERKLSAQSLRLYYYSLNLLSNEEYLERRINHIVDTTLELKEKGFNDKYIKDFLCITQGWEKTLMNKAFKTLSEENIKEIKKEAKRKAVLYKDLRTDAREKHRTMKIKQPKGNKATNLKPKEDFDKTPDEYSDIYRIIKQDFLKNIIKSYSDSKKIPRDDAIEVYLFSLGIKEDKNLENGIIIYKNLFSHYYTQLEELKDIIKDYIYVHPVHNNSSYKNDEETTINDILEKLKKILDVNNKETTLLEAIREKYVIILYLIKFFNSTNLDYKRIDEKKLLSLIIAIYELIIQPYSQENYSTPGIIKIRTTSEDIANYFFDKTIKVVKKKKELKYSSLFETSIEKN